MSWKHYLKKLTENWPSFSTVGAIHVHGVIVDYEGLRRNPPSVEAFLAAIQGPAGQSSGFVPVKQFYEDVSRQKLRFSGVTVERFRISGNEVDVDGAYEQFFRAACDTPPRSDALPQRGQLLRKPGEIAGVLVWL